MSRQNKIRLTDKGFRRREALRLTLGAPLLALAAESGLAQGGTTQPLTQQALQQAPSAVVPLDPQADTKQLSLQRQWNGALCRSRLTNRGDSAVRIREVVLFDLALDLPPETRLYGEGFQMLSQTAGTLGRPVDEGNYTDAKHYKMPIPLGARAFYGMMTLTPPQGRTHLLAFTSCRRFSGQFYLRDRSLQVVIDAEELELKPGEAWELEEFMFRTGAGRAALLDVLGKRLAENHPRLRSSAPPAGWCSWYCFGPRVTAEQVLGNLDFIAKHAPGLKYIQIDDGYQPAMGDWLETGAAFGGDVRGVLKKIRERGFEPAIWVAPFIAEEKSHLFRQHPDWFIKDPDRKDGAPLRSDKVSFGGWRCGPWYALDGTHPEAQRHLESVFRTMRHEWGCTYFKLDANFWGAMHGGRFHDARATRIEAYRRGMQAILRGAGDSFILGCNHPIWASLGLIHGLRSSNDITRKWERIATTGRQNLLRNWQNGRLWWNDPDAVVQGGRVEAGPDGVRVRRATEAVLIFAAGTSFNGFDKSPSRKGADASARAAADLDRAAIKPFAALRQAHVRDYQSLFNRVSLDLGAATAQSRLPTDERIARFGNDGDPALAALYFQFGRYLMIAGSRPGGQPLNLQGLWNPHIIPPWAGAYTTNINTQWI